MAKKKVRQLSDIELREVSLVDKSANKKEFLFFKQEGKSTKKLKKKINIVIDSDGTISGTKIVVNKDEIKDLRDFSFSFYRGEDGDTTRAISCSYSKFVETDDGFSRSETFYLSKGNRTMDKKIQEQLEEYFGKDEKIDFEKAEESDVIIKSLKTINEYQEDFTDDLETAVGVIAKQAGFCDTIITKMIEKKNDKEDISKAGAKFSKENLAKIKAAVEALKALADVLPTEKSDKSDNNDDENNELRKTISELTKSIEQIEKKKDDETKDELAKTIKDLTDKVAVLEKGTGVKKSEDGQDDDDNDDDDKKVKWPSISKGISK